MHVVAEETGGPSMQPTRAFDEAIVIGFDLGDVMVGSDRYGAERPRVGVGDRFVIHRHVEESSGTKRFARRLDLFQMPAKRFFALVDAEDRLEHRWFWRYVRRVLRHSVVQALSNRSLEGLMKNSAAT